MLRLRAMASYTDAEGSDKTAQAISANRALEARSTNLDPVFEDSEGEDLTTTTRKVEENTAAGQPVGLPVVARDPNGDVLTYTLAGGADAGLFDIDIATGQLLTKAALDKETRDEYTVMVTATDPSFQGPASDAVDVTITVTDVKEAPTVTGDDSPSYAERTPITTAVGTYMVADDEDDDTTTDLTVTLEGVDSGKLAITSPAGVLTFKASPNFESPGDANSDNAYEVTVRVTDSDGQTSTLDVTVAITNMEEDGTVTLSSVQPRVGVPMTATLTDVDGAPADVEWTWATSTNNSPGGDWALSLRVPRHTPTPRRLVTRPRTQCTCGRPRSYSDPQGSDSMAMEISANMVEADTVNRVPVFGDEDLETDGVQNDAAVRKVDEGTEAVATDDNLEVATDDEADNVGAPVTVDSDPNNANWT